MYGVWVRTSGRDYEGGRARPLMREEMLSWDSMQAVHTNLM